VRLRNRTALQRLERCSLRRRRRLAINFDTPKGWRVVVVGAEVDDVTTIRHLKRSIGRATLNIVDEDVTVRRVLDEQESHESSGRTRGAAIHYCRLLRSGKRRFHVTEGAFPVMPVPALGPSECQASQRAAYKVFTRSSFDQYSVWAMSRVVASGSDRLSTALEFLFAPSGGRS